MPIARATDGADLHWEQSGSGPALILGSGLGGVASWWDPNRQALARRFTVLVFDQRGTGRSSKVRVGSVEQMSDDLVTIMDAAKLDRAHYLGHSTGGAIGVATALDHPGRLTSLLIYASTTCGDPYRRKLLGLRSRIHAGLGIEAYAAYTTLLLYPPSWINAHENDLAKAEALAPAQLGPPDVQESRLAAILAFDRRAELGRINVPTLVLCADDDVLTPRYFSEEYARLVPGARAHWEPSGGHALSRTEPDLFNRIAVDFFSSLDPP